MSVHLPPRVLLVARDMLGDLVNTTGAVRSLAAAFPETAFTLEGGAAAPELGFPTQVMTRARHTGLPGRIKRILKWKRLGFGACIVLDDGHTHARLARLAGIKNVYGIHRGKPEIFTASVPFDESAHDLFGQLGPLLNLLGISAPDLRPLLMPSDHDEAKAQALFLELQQPEILLHPGASDAKKTWPDETWNELISLLGSRRVAVIGGPGERPERFGIPAPKIAPRVLEYAALLSKIKVLVTPDTGPAHLAAAMNTPTVVIYGPTDPARFRPWDNGNQVLLYQDEGCRHYGTGCAHLRVGVCQKVCVGAVTPKSVADATKGFV